MNTITIAIHGLGGRMGQAVAVAAAHDRRFTLAAGIEKRGYKTRASPIPIVTKLAALPPSVDGIIDFSAPAASLACARACGARKLFCVIGTTGFTPAQWRALQTLARRTPIFQANNMSAALHLLSNLVRQAAAGLPDWDIELTEEHHAAKQDAPSGTALVLATAAARARGMIAKTAPFPMRLTQRKGKARAPLGIHSVRGGALVGSHEVLLAGNGESLRLRHEAQSRAIFADGALGAAAWLARLPAQRLYTMDDRLASKPAKRAAKRAAKPAAKPTKRRAKKT